MRQLHRYLMGTVVGLLLASALAVLSAQPTGQGVYPTYQIAYLLANTTVQVLTGTGVLHTVCVNTKGASSNTATLFDNTASSGATIAIIDTTANVGCLLYDVALTTGLRVVTAAGTAPNLSISYRALR